MSVLTKTEIIEKINSNELYITPILDQSDTFDSTSINVRLGNEFIIMKKQTFPTFDIFNFKSNIEEYQKKIRINFKESFTLHPGELILSSTLEYIAIPENLMAYVIGKSSWGRVGLIIATATKVDPGFKGCITLEIINEGESPIVLYPGTPIAQLILHTLEQPIEAYNGNFNFSVGPVFTNFDEKRCKWKFWNNHIE